jgi:hypothetical protein
LKKALQFDIVFIGSANSKIRTLADLNLISPIQIYLSTFFLRPDNENDHNINRNFNPLSPAFRGISAFSQPIHFQWSLSELMVIADLLQSTSFAKALLESLPCGFLLLDKAGRVRMANNILDRILKVNKKTAIGKGAGNTLGFLHANAHPMGCGFGECCNYCEVQKITFNSISTNQKQRTRAELNIVIDGQVRDLALLISASPLTHNGEAFCLLLIEDPGALKAFTPPDTRDGFRGIVGQSDYMRVLQDGSFEPVGSEKTVRVNVRVISATNKKLEEEVTTGRFRHDLYYRLCVMPIIILPLRDRREDIPLLLEHFIAQFSEEARGKKISLFDTALPLLTSDTWPGNVRELINTIKFASVKCKGHRIQPEHLPPTLRLNMSKLYPLQHRQPKLRTADVVNALKKAGGNKCRAAEILGVSRSTLYRFFMKQKTAEQNSEKF